MDEEGYQAYVKAQVARSGWNPDAADASGRFHADIRRQIKPMMGTTDVPVGLIEVRSYDITSSHQESFFMFGVSIGEVATSNDDWLRHGRSAVRQTPETQLDSMFAAVEAGMSGRLYNPKTGTWEPAWDVAARRLDEVAPHLELVDAELADQTVRIFDDVRLLGNGAQRKLDAVAWKRRDLAPNDPRKSSVVLSEDEILFVEMLTIAEGIYGLPAEKHSYYELADRWAAQVRDREVPQEIAMAGAVGLQFT